MAFGDPSPTPRIQSRLVMCPSCHDVVEAVDLTAVPEYAGECEHCGQWWESTSPRARFCGRHCQLAAYREQR